MLCLLSGQPGFNCWISFAQAFSCIYCEVLTFVYLDLYVQGDDSSISTGSFMQTKHLYILIHIRIRVRFVPSNIFKPFSNYFWDHSKVVLFCGSILLCVFCLCLCYTVLSVSFSHVITCFESTDLLALMFMMCFCTFLYGVLGKVWFLIVLIPALSLLCGHLLKVNSKIRVV